MSSNIGDFVRELDSASVAVEDDALELKRLVSLQLLDGLVYGTPVGNPDLSEGAGVYFRLGPGVCRRTHERHPRLSVGEGGRKRQCP